MEEMYGLSSFSSAGCYSNNDYAVTSSAELAGFVAGSSEYAGVVGAMIELGSSQACTQLSSSPEAGGRWCSSSRSGSFSLGVIHQEEAQPLTMTATANNNNNTCFKPKISSHPLYPKLLQAYIDLHKVGAPPEVVDVLDGILHENYVSRGTTTISSSCLGDDPELDEFMETYCGVLVKYKSYLERPFNEANEFISNMQTQLDNICNSTSDTSGADTMAISSSIGEHEIKERLMREYGEYMSSLKQEFSQRKKNGKLSQHARQALLDWWSAHYNWPYPTEAEKVILAASTGLDRKQINNWFINQRKRHWKPLKNIHFNLLF